MKKFIILLVCLTSCSNSNKMREDIYHYGEKARVVAGFYKGSKVIIKAIYPPRPESQLNECKVNEYKVVITNNDSTITDYICQEDLRD